MSNYQEGQIENLKLVIWDLDETLWKGTIDCGDIPEIPVSHIELIKALTDRGIVNSICSKNDKGQVKTILMEKGIWNLFVFPSIDWSAKGNRIKEMLTEMGLGAVNTLFIDDDYRNIQEAEFCVSGLITAYPTITERLLEEIKASDIKIDKTHKRLEQYKILEEKAEEKRTFGSAMDFLISCHIKLVIHTDCVSEETRIFELIHRSNKLNFTKVRSSEEELKSMLINPNYKCGTVWVFDRFGDYGLVGFYALRDGRAEHFLFSCRMIGMGIEQYVFQILGCPEITIVGEVLSELGSKAPFAWINVDDGEENNKRNANFITRKRIILIGGCDLEQTAFYLEQSGVKFDKRFNYVANKRFECHPDSSFNLRATIEYSEEDRRYILNKCIFYDEDVFYESLFTGSYDVVIYSPLIDYANGFYESKTRKGTYAVYGNRDFPQISSYGFMNREEQRAFKEEFRFLGGVTPQMLRDNLEWLINELPSDTKIMLLNAAEIDFPHPLEPERYISHIEMNKVMYEVALNHSNVDIIDVAKMITTPSDYIDNIRHYSRNIYYQIAHEILGNLKNYGAVDRGLELDISLLHIKGLIQHMIYRKKSGRLETDIHSEMKMILKKAHLFGLVCRIHRLLLSK